MSVRTTESAGAILAIDGCPLNCARNCLEQAGFRAFEHLQLADLGMEKGKSPVNDVAVETVAARGRQVLSPR